MECPCCCNENNEVMKLNEFGQFLCIQCYTPLNIGRKSVISSTEKTYKIEKAVYLDKKGGIA